MEEGETSDNPMGNLPIQALEDDTQIAELDKSGNIQKQPKTIISVNKPFSCDSCKKSFAQKNGLRCHVKRCKFRISERLEQFMNAANANPQIKYGISKYSKFQTEVSNNKETKNKGKSFSCDKCKQTFKTKHDENNHLKECEYILGNTCSIVNSKSVDDNSRKRKKEKKSHQCDLCEKSFVSKSSLNSHKKVHCGEKPYSCEKCWKRFGHINGWTRHVRTSCKYRLSERLSAFISANSKESSIDKLSPSAQKLKYRLPPVIRGKSKKITDQSFDYKEAQSFLCQEMMVKEEAQEIAVKKEIQEIIVKEEVEEMEECDMIVKEEI